MYFVSSLGDLPHNGQRTTGCLAITNCDLQVLFFTLPKPFFGWINADFLPVNACENHYVLISQRFVKLYITSLLPSSSSV